MYECNDAKVRLWFRKKCQLGNGKRSGTFVRTKQSVFPAADGTNIGLRSIGLPFCSPASSDLSMLDIAVVILVITALLAYANQRFMKLPMTIGVMASSLVLSASLGNRPDRSERRIQGTLGSGGTLDPR